jgi:hypothetical protein
MAPSEEDSTITRDVKSAGKTFANTIKEEVASYKVASRHSSGW